MSQYMREGTGQEIVRALGGTPPQGNRTAQQTLYITEATGRAIVRALGGTPPEDNPAASQTRYITEATGRAILEAIEAGGGGGEGWDRPAKYPNYDLISLTGFHGVYLTYDLTLAEPAYRHISIMVRGEGNEQGTVERGHISGGTFVADESFSTKSYKVDIPLDISNGEVQIWRAYCDVAETSDFSFENISSIGNTAGQQPCVEMYSTMTRARQANSTMSPMPTLKSATFNGATVNSTLYGAFASKYGLEQLIFKNSTAVITDVRSLISQSVMLTKIDFGGISFNAESSLSFFGNGTGLKKLKFPTWTGLSGGMTITAQALTTLEELDFTQVDLSGVTGWGANVIQNAIKLTKLRMNGCDMSGLTSEFKATFPALVDLYPPTIYISQNWSGCQFLSHESLMRIINGLPTVNTTQTLTLGASNTVKLTAEEIAIATGKGWTVA